MSLISIIIPVHNCELYVEKCIKSIQNQDYKNLEIIVVVNNSQDRSFEICEKLSKLDSRIKLLNTQKSGVSHARNLGLKYSTGEYISFIDSDDYISPIMFSNLLNNLIKSKSDISICSFEKISSGSFADKLPSSNDKLSVLTCSQSICYFLEGKIQGYVWGKLFDRRVINSLKFKENFVMCEDELFLLEAIQNTSNICITTAKYYYYVQHDNSVCNSNFKEEVRWDCIKSKKIIFNIIEVNYPKYVELARNNYVCELIRYCILAVSSNSCISIDRKKKISRLLRREIIHIYKIDSSWTWKLYCYLVIINYNLFSMLFSQSVKFRLLLKTLAKKEFKK